MKVLFLVPRLDKASTRYRVLQYLPFLEGAGISHEIKTFSKVSRNWLEFFRQLKGADAVFIQKKLFSPAELFFVRKAARRIIYDFDDAVMFKDGPASSRETRRQQKRFAATAKTVDLIIAGNSYLADQARAYNSNVRILPTPIEMNRYLQDESKREQGKGIVLGWIGSRSTLKYLKDISPALERLGRRFPGMKLKIVADEFFDLENVEVIKKPWSSEDEIGDLNSFDIGLMPLRDDDWTRGKCGFKLLQCMGVGVPVVCSPVGINCEIVTEGEEGFWATTQDEWVGKLKTLIQDSALRTRMGSKAREKILQKYSLEVNGPLLVKYFLSDC